MTEYVSDIKTLSDNDSDIFAILSDPRKLELFKDKIKDNKLKDLSYDEDSCTLNVNPIGKIRFQIIERVPNSTIKFEAQQLPFKLYLWIQLKQVAQNDTKIKLTVKADLNAFLKPMVSKPLQEALNKMAEALSVIPYSELK